MKFIVTKILTAAVPCVLVAGFASAGPVVPTFDSFTDFPAASFGGTGIPTDPTAITTFTGFNGETVTLGLSATQRYANPPLTSNSGTYQAQPGFNDGLQGESLGTTWNFNFFIDIAPAVVPPIDGGEIPSDLNGEALPQPISSIGDYGIRLFYDLDKGVQTDKANLGIIDFAGAPGQRSEGSQNLSFDYLAGIPVTAPFITLPSVTSFDPLASGEYSFLLEATITPSQNTERVAINVNVGEVPAPATVALIGLGLAGLGWKRRKQA